MELLLRLQADQLGVAVTRADVTETTALGAAYLAGLGVGIWSTGQSSLRRTRASTRVEPSADRATQTVRMPSGDGRSNAARAWV